MNSPTPNFEYEKDRARFRVFYENGDSEDMAVTKIGPDLYRLEESLFVGDAVYGDVIRCKPTKDGSWLFEEIVERSKLKTQTCIMSRELLASDAVRSILDSVMEAGGMWEQVFGGVLIVHTPAEITEAVSDRLKKAALMI